MKESNVNSEAKYSFKPISNKETEVLILGSMPGDKSIELNEYYGHTRNRFWKIIATITDNELPITYEDKKELLLKEKIGVWDIVYKADRKGSMDSAIKNELPNDLERFVENHKNLKIIAFNGKKSEALFNKYFDRKKHLKYSYLPSSSPANARINFEKICKIWQQTIRE
ncbi:DNA-deoxyinosine glycosylase [Weeksellaceae bacterium TAE3-ERU29]|nr:DNA-deoxyinosine glycosylase [Weeksellaceae bacterium TAE3-ERU29]